MEQVMNKIKQIGFTQVEGILALAIAVVGVGGATGWILNIVKLCHSSFQPINPLLVLRFIGVLVAPLGAILGYI